MQSVKICDPDAAENATRSVEAAVLAGETSTEPGEPFAGIAFNPAANRGQTSTVKLFVALAFDVDSIEEATRSVNVVT